MKVLMLLLMTLFCLPTVNGSVRADEIDVQVSTDFVNLHSGPGRGYPIVQVALKGEGLTILSKRTDWVQVRFKQHRYWLARADLLHLYTDNKQQFDVSDDKLQQFQQRQLEAGLMFGDFNGSSFYQLSLSYLFSPYIQTELALGQANGEQADNLSAELSLYLNPLPEWPVSPYFGLGGGVLRTSPRTVLVQTPDRNNSLASVEFGLRYYISRNILARAGYRRSVIITDRNENEEIDTWKLGFSVFF
uniref:SH3b domain-containing protein n=1 Tax=Rheinheimera sp. BAL341 TaxID=1708203 RepID=A0A486XIA1_9GAMM